MAAEDQQSGDIESSVPPSPFGAPLPAISFLSVKIADSEVVSESSLLSRSRFVRYNVSTSFRGDGCEDIEEERMWRRYREFDLFRQYLCMTYPCVIVPPIPEKKITVDVGDPELIGCRSQALELFLQRCIDHPVISKDKVLRLFLFEHSGFDSTKQISSKVKDQPLFMSPSPAGVPDQRLIELDAATSECCRCMKGVMQQTERIAALEKQRCRRLVQMSESLRDWSMNDRDLADPLAVASGRLQSCGEDNIVHWSTVSEMMNQTVGYYFHCGEALRNVLYQSGNISAESGSTSLASYFLSGGATAEASRNPAISQKRRERAEETSEAISEEVRRLKDHQSADLKAMLAEFARMQTINTRKMLSAWLKLKDAFQPIAAEPVD